MKILINGYTVNENLKINRFNKEELTSIKLASHILNHIKKNKGIYIRLVLITAFILHFNINFIYADSLSASLDATFEQLIVLLNGVARWGCLGMGLKKLIEEMLSGASFKQASVAGMQYWLCYIFIQFYPRLFDMIKM